MSWFVCLSHREELKLTYSRQLCPALGRFLTNTRKSGQDGSGNPLLVCTMGGNTPPADPRCPGSGYTH